MRRLKSFESIASLYVAIALVVVHASVCEAAPRGDLVRFVPRESFMIIGVDFVPWRTNDVFLSMERNGQIWSYESDSEVMTYLRDLRIDPKKDVKAFVFSRYLNPYGSSGKLHVFEVTRDLRPELQKRESTPYLKNDLFRVAPKEDRYAALVGPNVLAVGGLNEVKTAVDLGQGKLQNMAANNTLQALYRKLPATSAVWGLSLPLPRRKAAAAKAQQSTSPFLEAFEHYYFYGVPTKSAAQSHFYGQAVNEKQATVVSAFMIGTLTVTKFRADSELAETLDQINIEHNGRDVHVSALITSKMVDAYFSGDLGF